MPHEAERVRAALYGDPFVDNTTYGRLVEEAADADERAAWAAECDPDDGCDVPLGPGERLSPSTGAVEYSAAWL